MNIEKFKEALQDAEYVKELAELDFLEAIQAKLAEKGLELSLDEVENLVEQVVKAAEKKDTELSENDLDDVAGGFVTPMLGVAAALVVAIGINAIHWIKAKRK